LVSRHPRTAMRGASDERSDEPKVVSYWAMQYKVIALLLPSFVTKYGAASSSLPPSLLLTFVAIDLCASLSVEEAEKARRCLLRLLDDRGYVVIAVACGHRVGWKVGGGGRLK